MRNTRRNYRDRGRRVCVCGGGPKFRTHGARERTDMRSDDRRWRVTTHRARRLTNGPTRARSSSCRWCLAACTVAVRRCVCACVRARRAPVSRVRPTGAPLGGPATDYAPTPCGRRRSRQRCSRGRADRAAASLPYTTHTHTHTHIVYTSCRQGVLPALQ